MTNYTAMSIDQLVEYRDLWPAQQSEWTRAELVLQKRLAVKHAFLNLAEELRDEGKIIASIDPHAAYDQGFETGILAGMTIAVAPQKEAAQ